MTLGYNLTYDLPTCEDRENLTFRVKAQVRPTTTLPSFMKFTVATRSFEFSPVDVKTDVGIFEVEVLLDDLFAKVNTYKFKLTVDKEKQLSSPASLGKSVNINN